MHCEAYHLFDQSQMESKPHEIPKIFDIEYFSGETKQLSPSSPQSYFSPVGLLQPSLPPVTQGRVNPRQL